MSKADKEFLFLMVILLVVVLVAISIWRDSPQEDGGPAPDPYNIQNVIKVKDSSNTIEPYFETAEKI